MKLKEIGPVPNAVNYFKRMNVGQLENLFDLEPDSAKGVTTDQRAKIDAWVPEC